MPVLALTLAVPAIAATQLTGAGSTFDNPFFSKAFYMYSQMHGDVAVNYQSIGSGGGIAQFTARTVDFGATDVPMNREELKKAGAPVLQVPVALGGVAVSYNLPGIHSGVRLTRSMLVNMFLGKMTKWNDPQIVRLNRGTKLPDLNIVVAHRSDGSGTTYIFTDFLSHVSGEWKSKVGTGKSVQWPASSSVGSKGNEGVAGIIRNTPGAIGYIELAYAIENHVDTAAIQNQSGNYVNCSKRTVAAAASTKANISATDFSIVDRTGKDSYPIAGYSWIVAYERPADKGRGATLKTVLAWLVGGQAQGIASGLNYVPLPNNVRRTAVTTISRMSV
ncbi:MAG TPA: phosphate ABC transporter substrate-binding protein PstS [Candidatus Rubrimentiphilum sp.]|nr:phosphate ABC transporter substrate-binding protein PstS [Candidatus Rubrimentiphilum sp.]